MRIMILYKNGTVKEIDNVDEYYFDGGNEYLIINQYNNGNNTFYIKFDDVVKYTVFNN